MSDLTAARRLVGQLARGWNEHRKMCGQCSHRTAACVGCCEDGWDIAKRLAAARAAVRDLSQLPGQQQPALF
jgi:hypothetical protein